MTERSPSGAPVVRCPSCQKSLVYSTDNPWRPFCSERCRGVDLGAWASERYRVAAAPPQDDDDEILAPPPA